MKTKTIKKEMAEYLNTVPRCMVCTEYIYESQEAHVFAMIGHCFGDDPHPRSQLMAVHCSCYYNSTKLNNELVEHGEN